MVIRERKRHQLRKRCVKITTLLSGLSDLVLYQPFDPLLDISQPLYYPLNDVMFEKGTRSRSKS